MIWSSFLLSKLHQQQIIYWVLPAELVHVLVRFSLGQVVQASLHTPVGQGTVGHLKAGHHRTAGLGHVLEPVDGRQERLLPVVGTGGCLTDNTLLHVQPLPEIDKHSSNVFCTVESIYVESLPDRVRLGSHIINLYTLLAEHIITSAHHIFWLKWGKKKLIKVKHSTVTVNMLIMNYNLKRGQF